jgi:hypothetical protein
MTAQYPAFAYERNADGTLTLNYYGNPIVTADQFMEEHRAMVPASGGNPPFCTCGWTRHGGHEMADHLAAMED